MRSGIALAAIGLAGCDLIFELNGPDDRTDEPRDIAIELVQQHVANDAQGMPAKFPDPVTLDGISVQLHDGTRPELVLDGVGRITFTGYRGERYRFTYQRGGEPLTIESGVADPRFPATVLGRLDRIPVAQSTTVTYNSLDTEVHRYRVMSSGVWTTAVGGSPPQADLVVPWSMAKPFDGDVALLEATKNDRIYLGSYVFEGSQVPYERLVDLATEPLEMVNAADNLVGSTLAGTKLACLQVDADIPGIDARLAEHAGYDVRNWSVSLVALPSPDTDPLRGFPLATGTGTSPNPISAPISHADVSAFPGYRSVARFDLLRERIATGPGGPITLRIQSTHVAEFDVTDAGCPANTVDLFDDTHRVAVPTAIRIDGNQLTEDGRILTVTEDVRLAWQHDGGRVDMFLVTLIKLEAGVGESTARRVHSFLSVEPRIEIAPELFELDGTYLFSIAAISGVPDASRGDLDTLAYPYDFTAINSFTFRVLR